MSGKKFKFLHTGESSKKEDVKDVVKEDIEEEDTNYNDILDATVIEYVIKEFPTAADEIRDALTNLKMTLEKSIDFIEDKSSQIIKNSRDFELSNKYRYNSIKLHEISTNLKEYINWMESTKSDSDTNSDIIESIKIEEDKFKLYIPIFNDFTAITPKSFAIGNSSFDADNWDDLIMKTASILTKNYKNNKESEITTPEYSNIIRKKSYENELRDTVIDMLIEYKINLNDYKILSNKL